MKVHILEDRAVIAFPILTVLASKHDFDRFDPVCDITIAVPFQVHVLDHCFSSPRFLILPKLSSVGSVCRDCDDPAVFVIWRSTNDIHVEIELGQPV